jgi:hypothetical protein
VHGFYSADIVVLDHENKQEFAELQQALTDEYEPRSASETADVFDLAVLYWKKRRLEAHFKQALNEWHAYSETRASPNDWNLIADHMRAAAKEQTKAALVVCNEIRKHVERAYKPNEAIAQSKPDEYEKASTLAKELQIMLDVSILPVLQAAEKQKLDHIERAYAPDIIEKDLKIRAELDRRIEKTLKRMVINKQYKEFYLVKSTPSPSLMIEPPSAKQADVAPKTGPVG